jgi:hypothetical protein
MAAVILVTGGTGLVGRAIQHVIETEPVNSRFGKKDGETWIFANYSMADLRCVLPLTILGHQTNGWLQGSEANERVV